MDVDEHLVWLVSALRLSRDSDGVNKDKLVQNVNNCFTRVKKKVKTVNIPASQSSEEIQDFQAKASVLLLLCLPEIRELSCVVNCEDFQSLISSLPELSDPLFFTVVRTQKIYFFLSPLLSWLPTNVVETLSKDFFHYTNDVTPVTLTISVELLKSLVLSHQYRDTHHGNFQSITECLKLLVKFFSLKTVSNETPSMIKFSGYFFMYLFECLYLLLAAYVGYKIRDPDTFSCVEAWTKLWKTEDMSTEGNSLLYNKEILKSMLMLCQNNNREVTVDMWMEWSEQKLPQNVTGNPLPPNKGQGKSIQLVICNIAFDILRLLVVDYSRLKKDLVFGEYHELIQFLQQVATDPDYDPDHDLTLEQLIKEININDDRQGKLLGFLVERDGVIACDDACCCLKEHGAALDNQMKIILLENSIKWLKEKKPYIPETINVILDLVADLSPEQLNTIIEGNLSAGLDDIMKTPSFKSQLTAVFNQMADEKTAQPSGKHVWLCLQSGKGVVDQAVRLAVTMTGLVPVMVQALADLPQVSQAKLPSGSTLLASTLVEWQTSKLCDREERELIALVKNLLKMRLLDPKEVLHLMVEPFLVIECSRNLEKLILPLELLKEVMTDYVDVVVRPGPVVVSLVLALVHIMDATVCLDGQEASTCLTIRCLALADLVVITNVLVSNQKKFEEEITLLKQMVCQYNLHPWSVMHISQMVDAELSRDSSVDLLLQALMKGSSDLPQGHALDAVTCAALDCAGLKKMSQAEWIITLLQLLPHCSESEWRSAFFITDYVLGSQDTVFPVLEVFQGILHLVCESLVPTSLNCRESHILLPPVSLCHCFTFFASASMIYLEVKFKIQNTRERFLNFADIFRWWCCTVPSYSCNPELPSLFLARLCGALEEMVVSGKLKVQPDGHTVTSTECGAASSAVIEKLNESLPKKHVNKTNAEISERKGKQHEGEGICNRKRKEFHTSEIDVKKELEQITFFMVRYVPNSNLLASVASRLKKMYEV